uniref:Checkpoint protein n=1 Tax=Parascaris univalens TaxID=6257 RepID=A0A915BIR4_PARUN
MRCLILFQSVRSFIREEIRDEECDVDKISLHLRWNSPSFILFVPPLMTLSIPLRSPMLRMSCFLLISSPR